MWPALVQVCTCETSMHAEETQTPLREAPLELLLVPCTYYTVIPQSLVLGAYLLVILLELGKDTREAKKCREALRYCTVSHIHSPLLSRCEDHSHF